MKTTALNSATRFASGSIIVLLALVLSGCASTYNQPTEDSCRKVWVWSIKPNHSDIVIRLSDLPASFLEIVPADSIPAWAEYVSFGVFDLEWSRGERSQIAALLPSPAGLLITLYSSSPETIASNLEIAPVALSSQSFSSLLDYIAAELPDDMRGLPRVFEAAVVNMPESYPEYWSVTLKVPAKNPYHAFNYCHAWVLRAFREAGVDGVARNVYSAARMLEEMESAFPRQLQKCEGYNNSSAESPRIQRTIILKPSDE